MNTTLTPQGLILNNATQKLQPRTKAVGWDWLQPFISQYGLTLAYNRGNICRNRYNGNYHGTLSGNAVEFNWRGANFATSLSAAHSLKRPSVLEQQECALYFRVQVFY